MWRPEEERALLSGVERHGLGAWELIRTDPDLKSLLRSAVILERSCRSGQRQGFADQLGLFGRAFPPYGRRLALQINAG